MKRILLTLAAAVVAAAAPAVARAQGFVVIVNSAGPASVSKDDASKAFLKKGGTLVAVDQGRSAAVRDAFSKAVLGRPASAMVTYWQQQIFAGKDVPPPQKNSDAEVVAFVKANPYGIGYVSAGADVAGVKTVTLQ
jgi:ABC-type phosphate transport system substrate-binding protein